MEKSIVSLRKFFNVLSMPNAYSLAFLFLMWDFYAVFYYFGDIIDFFGWTSLRWEGFYTIHDVHRAVFIFPIIYAAYVFGVKTTLTVSLLTLMVFLPRAIFISPYPDPLLRMLIFMIIAGTVGYLTAVLRKQAKKYESLLAIHKNERDRLFNILETMEDGVLIIGPDYRIRYMNSSIKRNLGDCVGLVCYKSIYGLNEPCPEICQLPKIINGGLDRWKYTFPDGKIYEVQASPLKDIDGSNCQLALFRDITRGKKSPEEEAR